VYRLTMILLMAVSSPLLAEEKPNCDPNVGVVDKSCQVEAPRVWWACDEDTDLTPDERQVTEQQQRRLESFALGIFDPELPGYGLPDFRFSRADLIKRFGEPRSAKSKDRFSYDPIDRTEIVTTWEYPGLTITTVARRSTPDELELTEGEIVDATVPLRHGLRVGQPIERWVEQLGRPNCYHRHVIYEGEYYFECGEGNSYSCIATYQADLFVDNSGRVQRVKWSHPMP